MWRALSDLFLHFVIIARAIQKGRLFSYIFGQFLPFRWSKFDLISFALSMNTSSYSPIALGTYNFLRVEFVLKRKMINTTAAMAELYTTRLGGSHFIHSRS